MSFFQSLIFRTIIIRKHSLHKTQVGDTALNSNGTQNQHIKGIILKNSGTGEFKLDSAGNSILKITTKANFYHTESEKKKKKKTTSFHC